MVADTGVDLPAATAPVSAVSGGNDGRLLVVDDEFALTHYLVELLEGGNYVVDVFTDSVKSLKAISCEVCTRSAGLFVHPWTCQKCKMVIRLTMRLFFVS
ncbi:MAG: hypothetical protein ACXWT0_08525 [Methylobacter sp.]